MIIELVILFLETKPAVEFKGLGMSVHEERLCRGRCCISFSIAKSQNIAISGCQIVELCVRGPEGQGC